VGPTVGAIEGLIVGSGEGCHVEGNGVGASLGCHVEGKGDGGSVIVDCQRVVGGKGSEGTPMLRQKWTWKRQTLQEMVH